MKKWKIAFAMLIIIGSVITKWTVAEAAENEIVVVHAEQTVELLSDEEVARLSQEIQASGIGQPMTSNSSYSVYSYTDAFDFYFNGEWQGRADTECIVWHYTDGKVHLYQRTIQLTKLVTIGGARIYGSIVNTDGSYSYTTGDRVYLYLDEGTMSFAIDFYVSNTEGYFTCYVV